MSDSITNTTVNLHLNGQEVSETLANLRKRAAELQLEIAKIAATGDKVQLKKLRREFNDVNRQIKQIESSTQQVENVLRRLDRATPQELNKAIGTLTKQLNYIERGSVAWDEHTKKIRMLKDELSRVNAEMARSVSWVERFNNSFQKWQTIGAGVIGAVTGLTLAGRKAVQDYAEMEQEMANVRKYTGMTAEEVAHLNTEFLKIDTRSPRDQLNRLAQEAGRLGKTSEEDVLGFVKAADQINVALDDLGEGATLTLSKLTSIFGDEERLGTEQSLLAVGSVINELSQNCTASAPYLAQFAQRLAGVGAQAKMTIPEIMAYGAVLDANGQKVEMSATALSKVIMNLFKDTGKIASATGMDLEELNAALKRSTNEGLLMLLQRLNDLGGIETLAPVFKDMGENGARASAVLAALAGNIDMIKWEQEEANKAFNEATSITNEFNVQNTTVQAGIDKARKRFSELTIELGEKLLPVMKHVITSSSMTMRALNVMVDFIIKYKRELLALVATVTTYVVAVNLALIKEKMHAAFIAVKTAVLHVHRVAVLASSVAYNKLTGNVVRANAAMKLLNATMKMNPFGLALAALVAAVSALVIFIKRHKEAQQSVNRLTAEQQRQLNVQRQLEEHNRNIESEYAKQAGTVKMLTGIVENDNLSLEERRKALKRLQEIVPEYHATLTEEGVLINNNRQALDDYLVALKESIRVKMNQEKLEEIATKQIPLEDEIKRLEEENKAFKGIVADAQRAAAQGDEAQKKRSESAIKEMRHFIARNNQQIRSLKNQWQELEDLAKSISSTSAIAPAAPLPDDSGAPAGDDKKGKNKFQAEDDWKEKENALIRIAYARGQKDFEAYTQRMMQIEIDYNAKKLKHTDLEGNEEVTIKAAYYEALKKQQDHFLKGTVEDENRAYDELTMILKQRYVDGEMTARQYQAATELAELNHLRNIVNLYAEGSKERLKAEQNYHKASLRYQERHVQEDRRLQEQLQAQYFTQSFHLADPDSYQRDMRNLEIVHAQMLKAAGDNAADRLKVEKAFHEAKYRLARKYNIKEAVDMRDSFRSAIDDSVEWLESDGGQAMVQTFDLLVNQMSQIFSSLSEIVQAELDIQTAAIEKRYAAANSDAEGNKYREVQLERQKNKEIAKAKKEANRKMFAMQVIQAVAQTATSAIAAYSSAAAIPMVGFIMAPIAAAMAIAAGAIQIASIKKQQQASEATGYKEGGFTKKGKKDEIAGVVHAGEWVASQDLVNSPEARPLINALDYAQRTNTFASLKTEDVSRTITAPRVIADRLSAQGSIGSTLSKSLPAVSQRLEKQDNSLNDTLAELTKRLKEPFVTMNTVSGDYGIQQAQDEYAQLMKNKTPKSKR